MIISLKRFKTGKSKYAAYGILGGGGGKLSTHVEFPLEGLDMSQYITSEE